MRWLFLALTALLLSGCYVPTPFSMATLGIDAVSYFVSGKTATDHGISLAMDQDCALIRLLEGEVCRDNESYETAIADEALEPLPEDPDVARRTGASEAVVASAERAVVAMSAPQEALQLAAVSDSDSDQSRTSGNRGEKGEAGTVDFPAIPKAKPVPTPEPDADVSPDALDGEARRVEIVRALLLEGLITDEAIVTAAGPASLADAGQDEGGAWAAGPDAKPGKSFARSRWSEVGERVTVTARHDAWPNLGATLLGAVPEHRDWPDTRA